MSFFLDQTLICIAGPTATGKSDLAVLLAEKLGACIINADSRQFYRELNIGTAKPSQLLRSRVKHELIDCASLEAPWDVGDFVRATSLLIQEKNNKNSPLILVGGTGMYLKSLLFGLDGLPKVDSAIRTQLQNLYSEKGLPALVDELRRCDPQGCAQVDLTNPRRVQRALEVWRQTGKSIASFWTKKNTKPFYSHLLAVLDGDRAVLHDRIKKRTYKMMEMGLKEEALALWKKFPANPILQTTIGYSEWQTSQDEDFVTEKIIVNTRQLARRQITYFRAQPDVKFFDFEKPENAVEKILCVMKDAV